jgi:hypothetical protein
MKGGFLVEGVERLASTSAQERRTSVLSKLLYSIFVDFENWLI